MNQSNRTNILLISTISVRDDIITCRVTHTRGAHIIVYTLIVSYLKIADEQFAFQVIECLRIISDLEGNELLKENYSAYGLEELQEAKRFSVPQAIVWLARGLRGIPLCLIEFERGKQ